MANSIYNIKIDRQVIKLLGEHLYGDTPSVVNELIANAYDAMAKRVWITIKTTPCYEIEIQDDGVGMTTEDINNYYLNIGYNRRETSSLQESLSSYKSRNDYEQRDDMGQKGIGKLSVFSLSKNVDLISSKMGKIVGCNMDFDIICSSDDGQPTQLKDPEIDEEKLSDEKSGTKIVLHNVTKNLSKSYKYIKNSILRSFVLNDEKMTIFIRKDNDSFSEIKRESFCAYSQMDTLVTIGSEYDDIVKRVQNNDINSEYKRIFTYDEMVTETEGNRKDRAISPMPIKMDVFNKERNKQIEFYFKFSGWIGTVNSSESFKRILRENGYTDDEIKSKEITTIDDNRISIFSRGKIGEYNILPKLKTKSASDAYLIGEIFVDDFENESLIDMATSNRRGYQEDDPRYEALIKNLKLVVSKVIQAKQEIRKKRTKDKEKKETNDIKSTFINGQNKSNRVFQELSDNDRKAIEYDFNQFSRAVSMGYKAKKSKHLLISHKQDEVRFYGDFLINLILEMNPDLKNNITFTSNPDFSLKKGGNIFEELKECFRPDYYVVFLLTKSFYDSNACLAEVGAAWATNTQYMILPVDIDFSDVDAPLDKYKSSSKYKLDNEDELKNFCLSVKEILSCIDEENDYKVEEIMSNAKKILEKEEYKFEIPTYIPKRKFQAYPICKKCNNSCELVESKENELLYRCRHCRKDIKAEIR